MRVVSSQTDDVVYRVANDHERADRFRDAHFVSTQVQECELCGTDEADRVNRVQSDDPVPSCKEYYRARECKTDQHSVDGIHEERSLTLHPGPVQGCGLIDGAKACWGICAEIAYYGLPSLVDWLLELSRPLCRPDREGRYDHVL